MEVNHKIRELTEKIRKEGLEKVEAEASRIREEAREEAFRIIKDAEKQSVMILNKARREADSYAERVRADLRLSAEQLIHNLRNEICELLLDTVISKPVEKQTKDPRFVASLLQRVVENWKNCNEDVNLEVLLPGDMHQKVEEQFRKESEGLLNNIIRFTPSGNISGGFEIKPQNGHYKICFTDEAFEAFLKDSFRPAAKNFLFGEEK